LAYHYIPLEKRCKLEPTVIKTCFIGYMPTSRQYRLYNPINKRIIVFTAPTFKEDLCLQYDWKEELPGEVVIVFNPIEAPNINNTREEVIITIGEPEHKTPSVPISPETSFEAPKDNTLNTIIVNTSNLQLESTKNIVEQDPRTQPQRTKQPPNQYNTAYTATIGPIGPK
jgi:hypothetical protein